MALDYVRNLREMDEQGGEALRPAAKVSPEELERREAQARQTDYANGRFGHYRDQQGNWAMAWQAPGNRTSIVPPRFVEQTGAKLGRLPTGELVIRGADGEVLIPPQSWVVLYDGADEAIVADDEQFKRVMVREDAAQAVQDEPFDPEGRPVPPPPQSAPTVKPGPAAAPTQMIPLVSIDGFVAQVLQDNARLRLELEAARRWGLDRERDGQKTAEASSAWAKESAHWGRVAEQRQGRINWLEEQLRGAIGDENANDGAFEAFLLTYGQIYRDELAKIQMAEERRTNGPANEAPQHIKDEMSGAQSIPQDAPKNAPPRPKLKG